LDNENVWRLPLVFRAVMGFFRKLGVARILLKWHQDEADRLSSWFKLAGSTFGPTLYFSDDWRYIAPKWRDQSSLQPFVREVREKFHHHRHL